MFCFGCATAVAPPISVVVALAVTRCLFIRVILNVLKMSVRKRKYSDDFLKWGFTDIVNAGVERPQCVVCLEVLAHESMKPAKLQRHLKTKHPALKDKSIDLYICIYICI